MKKIVLILAIILTLFVGAAEKKIIKVEEDTIKKIDLGNWNEVIMSKDDFKKIIKIKNIEKGKYKVNISDVENKIFGTPEIDVELKVKGKKSLNITKESSDSLIFESKNKKDIEVIFENKNSQNGKFYYAVVPLEKDKNDPKYMDIIMGKPGINNNSIDIKK